MILVVALVAFAPLGARAGDITVYSPGIVNGPLKQLAASWTAETGNKVTFAGMVLEGAEVAAANGKPYSLEEAMATMWDRRNKTYLQDLSDDSDS